jgi:hypothetical protein
MKKMRRFSVCPWFVIGAVAALVPSAAWAAEAVAVPFGGAIAMTATASPNASTPQEVLCGGQANERFLVPPPKAASSPVMSSCASFATLTIS